MTTSPQFSIVIPYYNNRDILPLYFPSVYQLLKDNPGVTEIIAVDDNSSDSTSDWLIEYASDITIIRNNQNKGFGKSCLTGITKAKNEWIILLNSDIRIETNCIPPLTETIRKYPDLFEVSFFSFYENGEKFEGRKKFIPKTGLYKTRNNFDNEYQDRVYDTFYATGGHSLISRSKFLELNGFSPLYEPFYWEDADLSYRALKRGWKVFFDPRCKVTHCHKGSIRSSNSQKYIDTIQTRNKMLFFWSNVSSRVLWSIHITGMIFRFLTSWIAGDFLFYKSLFAAIKKLPQVVRKASSEKKYWKINDRYIFKSGKSNII
jgi:GT2 family glycosyltransferase